MHYQSHAISDIEQCWLHGFKAFHRDLDETANPYMRGTKQAHYWREGWWEAFFDIGALSTMYEQHYQQLDVDSLAG